MFTMAAVSPAFETVARETNLGQSLNFFRAGFIMPCPPPQVIGEVQLLKDRFLEEL